MLKNARIVLSTHQVLLDALSHGFVGMQRLALLVFDEAHHCTRRHAANQIMQHFYLPLARRGLHAQLPRILGLTASPVTRGRVSLDELRYVLCRVIRVPPTKVSAMTPGEGRLIIVGTPLTLACPGLGATTLRFPGGGCP